MEKKDFKNYICRPFCRFFREGEKEDMACRGAQIVALLVQRGLLESENMPCEGKNPYLWKERDSCLEKTVCHDCPFYAQDCDFQSKEHVIGSEPCGGYILISLLKKNGSISEADLMQTTYE